MTSKIITTALLVITLSLITPLMAQPRLEADALKELNALFQRHTNNDSSASAFRVIKDGKIKYSRVYGYANVEHRVPMTEHSLFNIASNSKQMTSYLILLLEQEGQLSIEDPISLYLPELATLEHSISIKQLCNHTHGLPNVDELADLVGFEQLNHKQVVDLCLKIRSLNFKPGTDYQYSNTGYLLLAEIISRVTKTPFETALNNWLLKPLKMQDSKAVGYYDALIDNKAYSYRATSNTLIESNPRFSTMGASGVYSSLHDLSLWSQHFYNDPQGIFKSMSQGTRLTSGKTVDYGLGLQFEQYKGIDIVFHGGGTDGYRSYILHVPKYNLSLIYLANDAGLSGLNVIYEGLELILKQDLKEPQTRTAESVGAFDGIYELNSGTFIEVSTSNDSLFYGPYGSDEKLHLPTLDHHNFSYPYVPYSKFSFNESGFKWRLADFSYFAKKIEPSTSTNPPNLEALQGIYINPEYQVVFQIITKNNQLYVRRTGHEDLPLTHLENETFFAINSNFGKIRFQINEVGSIEGLELSRHRLRHITFNKH